MHYYVDAHRVQYVCEHFGIIVNTMASTLVACRRVPLLSHCFIVHPILPVAPCHHCVLFQ